MPIYPDRKNGKLTGRFRVEVTVNGKRLRRRANGMREARTLEAELLGELQDCTLPPPTAHPEAPRINPEAITVGHALDRARGILWAGQATEARSYRKLERIASIVGETLPIDGFDVNAVDRLTVTLRNEGCSDATLNRYLSCVSTFLRFCKRRGIRKADLPSMEWRDEDENRIRWLSYDEEASLMELLPSPFDAVVYVAIRTGLRASELLSLTPDQLEPRWVHLWGTGTKSGRTRSVPITEGLYDLLASLVTTGTMPDYWQLRNEWDKARKAMGLMQDKTFVFHACRHTYATRAVRAGVSLRVLQQLMGHRTIQTTLRYAHVEDRTLSEAARKMTAFPAPDTLPKGGANRPNCPTPTGSGKPLRRFALSIRSCPPRNYLPDRKLPGSGRGRGGMVDAGDLKSLEPCSCGFESRRPHQLARIGHVPLLSPGVIS
ncbi:hypothetical protein GCM10011371_14210 [Novosphingobium marinum]|nr:hypothetical protein GCM10011371_14210 [Novosphingobium marinum]